MVVGKTRSILDPSRIYLARHGAARYFEGRTTDGDRPRLYSAWVRESWSRCDVLMGLGCGDSAVEHSIACRYAPDVPYYVAIDISQEMLDASRLRFQGLPGYFDRLSFQDAPAISELLGTTSGFVISTMIGRTFGNFDIETIRSTIAMAAKRGVVLFDFFEAPLDAFTNRMQYVAEHSKAMFMQPIFDDCVRVPRDTIEGSVVVERGFSKYSFSVTSEDEKEFELFSIRSFDSQYVEDALACAGLKCVFKRSVPDQVLPMTLMGFS